MSPLGYSAAKGKAGLLPRFFQQQKSVETVKPCRRCYPKTGRPFYLHAHVEAMASEPAGLPAKGRPGCPQENRTQELAGACVRAQTGSRRPGAKPHSSPPHLSLAQPPGERGARPAAPRASHSDNRPPPRLAQCPSREGSGTRPAAYPAGPSRFSVNHTAEGSASELRWP